MDFSPIGYTPDGVAKFAQDSQLLVKFFRHAELSQFKSKNAGVPIYDDVDMIEVLTPGEKDPVIVPATVFHQRRFPKQWEAYKAGIELNQSGTPIEMLFSNEPGTVKQLKHHNVFTVQQLANLNDAAKQMIGMGGQQLQDRAREYLAKASEGQAFHQMDAMQKKIEQLEAMLAEKGIEAPAVTTEPQTEARRAPGRPRKDQAAA